MRLNLKVSIWALPFLKKALVELRTYWIRPLVLGLAFVLGDLHLYEARAWAQTEDQGPQGVEINENPLHLAGEFLPAAAAAGQSLELRLNLDLDPPHYAYREVFALNLDYPLGLELEEWDIDPVVEFYDHFSRRQRLGVKGQAQLKAQIRLSDSMLPGEYLAKVSLTYQACTASYCLFPKTETLSIPLVVAELDTDGELILPATLEHRPPSIGGLGSLWQSLTDSQAFSRHVESHLWFVFLLVFLAGFLTSLTPCIFPMIPITLAVLGSRANSRGHWSGFLTSLVYVLGIALTYALLGVLAASTGRLFGSLLGHPLVVFPLALIFVLMGLSMYGLYEIRPPAFVTQRLGLSKSPLRGRLSAFFAGLVAGVVASPCVGPVLIAVLAYIAQSQNLVLGFFLMFVFALGMGLLFLALGTFSQLLNHLPRSGPWLEVPKFIFGSTMVAIALYFIQPVTPDRVWSFLAGLALILISSGYGAFATAPNIVSRTLQLRKGLLLAGFFVGVGLWLQAFFPHWTPRGALGPGLSQSPLSASFPRLNWEPYSREQLEQALSLGRPVILDFDAEWCAACKELERYTFSDPEVQKLAQDFALFKFDATHPNPAFRELQQKYNVLGLPFIVFYDSQGQRRDDLRLTGFEEATAFALRMRRALSAE